VALKSVDDIKDRVSEETLDGAIIAEITVSSGGKKITTFGGHGISVSIAVNSEFKVGISYKVIVVSDDGKTETLTGICVNHGGKLFVEVTAVRKAFKRLGITRKKNETLP